MIAGICGVCGGSLAIQTCRLCGRHICPQHFDREKGTCLPCSVGKSIE